MYVIEKRKDDSIWNVYRLCAWFLCLSSSSDEGNGVLHISHLNPPMSDDDLLAAVSPGPGGEDDDI